MKKFCLLPALTLAECSSNDLETVYGSDDGVHEITDFTFAVDPMNFDMIAGGKVNLLNSATNQKTFLYYIDQTDCKVRWHHLLDTTVLNTIDKLAISVANNKVYGLTSDETNKRYEFF